MILSHDKEFLFIHVPKTAGTNIRKWLLSQTKSKEDFWWWDNSGTDRAHLHEGNIEKYIDITKVQNDKYTIFGFVRNPYHRIFSAYNEVKWKGPCKKHSFEEVLKLYIAKGKLNELPVHFLPQVKFLSYSTHIYKYELLYESVNNISNLLNIQRLKLTFDQKKASRTYFENYSQSMIDIINSVYVEDFEKYDYYKIPEIIYKFRFPTVLNNEFVLHHSDINTDIHKVSTFKCKSIFHEIKLCTVAIRRQNSKNHVNRLVEILDTHYNEIRYYINSKWIISICESLLDYTNDPDILAISGALVMTFMVEKISLSNANIDHCWKPLTVKQDTPLYSGFWHYNNKNGDMLRNKFRRLERLVSRNVLCHTFYKMLIVNSIIYDNASLNEIFKHSNEAGKTLLKFL
jgi:hypothetical protein